MGPEQWIATILAWLVAVAICLTIFYWVIRLAVTHALRTHDKELTPPAAGQTGAG